MTRIATLLAAIALAGCATTNQPAMENYDFGIPEVRTTEATADVYVAEVRAAEWLGSTDMLYRLEYRDPRALKPYAGSRWAGTPAAMLTSRLRQSVGNGMAARGRQTKCTLALYLSEFSQVFKSEQDSRVVMHLRATLNVAGSGEREKVRELRIERPAPAPNAAGEAAAFVEVVKSAADELNAWIDASGSCRG
ncbi:MAG TPA: ABC-type transport auxiliary lipoprotein family protein [Burkholderiales bacterium]|nr:ABC-type transport auxiliary lipoprotein family protein [Burkholderiales bacterium]